MAEQVQIKVLIDTADAAKSVGDIRKSIKALNSEALAVGQGGAGFDELTKKAADLKDKMEDLNDSTKSLKGSGVERLNSSLGLLKQGFSDADPGKLGVAFKGLGAAMKAVPIFLLIEGVATLIQNFDKIVNVIPGLKALIDGITSSFKALTDFIGLTNFAGDEMTKKAIANAEKEHATRVRVNELAKKMLAEQAKEKAEAEAKREKEYKEHQDRIAKIDADRIAKGKALESEAIAERDKNDAAEITAKENLNTRLENLEADTQLKQLELQKIRDKAEIDALAEKAGNSTEQYNQAIAAKLLIDAKYNKDVEEINTNAANKKAADDKAAEDKKNADRKKELQAERNLAEAKRQANYSIGQKSLDGLSSLSSLYYTLQSNNVKKGSAEELKRAKEAFELNKKLALATAAITGIKTVQSAYLAGTEAGAASGGYAALILGPLYAATAGLATAAEIAKIEASQFEGGQSPTTTSISSTSSVSQAPSLGVGATGTFSDTPRLNDASLFGEGRKANTITGGGNQPIRAVVVESDITSTQERIKRYQTSSEL
jgi:hypothetical protein